MVLSHVYRVSQDTQGNIIPSVQGSVRVHGTGALAQIYNDPGGLQPIGNPLTSDPTYGSFQFYVRAGDYDLTFAKPGYTFEPVYDVTVSPSFEEGTFTLTGLGFSGAPPTGLARYVRSGNSVALAFPLITGTSNATTFYLEGLPPALQTTLPISYYAIAVVNASDFTSAIVGSVDIPPNTSTLQVYANNNGLGWTASGTKQMYATTIVYLLS
jgi:hypothetical protein